MDFFDVWVISWALLLLMFWVAEIPLRELHETRTRALGALYWVAMTAMFLLLTCELFLADPPLWLHQTAITLLVLWTWLNPLYTHLRPPLPAEQFAENESAPRETGPIRPSAQLALALMLPCLLIEIGLFLEVPISVTSWQRVGSCVLVLGALLILAVGARNERQRLSELARHTQAPLAETT